jgi:hypothetical protein
MPEFKGVNDIPSIPVTEKQFYQDIIIPNLIRCGAIAKNQLVKGHTYIGTCRNAEEAVWDGDKFIYQRYKFGIVFPEEINHFEDDDGFDVFVPLYEKMTDS